MTILCYHAIDPDWRSPISVRPDQFEAHCAWLARSRRVIGLGDAVPRLDRRGRLPRGLAALTFDDGFASLFEHGLPSLTRHALPATVFLVARTLAPEGKTVDWVDDPPARPPATLSRPQVLEMQEAGVRFESHSLDHRDLRLLSDEECERDLRASRELLEDLLARPVTLLAYPRGLHDARVRRAAERAGYAFAFTLPEAREAAGRFAIPRVGIYDGNGTRGLRTKTSPWYLAARTSRAYPPLRRAVEAAGSLRRRG
jgi:peptidoglycan/xylan/chitin deacetylase (PgdA/CDA1 family)